MMSKLESETLILSGGGGKMREKFGRILLEE